ncbi:DUF4156 domain-containing protein [Wenzhouxiangella sp. EGI_FJ10305]|uniref:DUF4156 domain-containing protein n=1 Tax=Wenzhouxiangella sp. EGI_FJ10305 TaxID=3243768 RepID=UPI0035D743AE
MRKALIAGAVAAALTAGCSWVKLERGAEGVRLVEPSMATNCERLGTTTTSVRERVAGVERSPGKVEAELADLARNSAWDLNGDTIVADGPVQDGERRFIIYRCRSR